MAEPGESLVSAAKDYWYARERYLLAGTPWITQKLQNRQEQAVAPRFLAVEGGQALEAVRPIVEAIASSLPAADPDGVSGPTAGVVATSALTARQRWTSPFDREHEEQQAMCVRFGCRPVPLDKTPVIAVSRNVRYGAAPLNGLRRHPSDGTSGWFIWGGDEFDDDLCETVNVAQLRQRCRPILPYLGLPPGWRFRIAPGHEGVWYDKQLLIDS